MNILLLGSGGREHALAWKISQSPLTEKLFIAPGNAGTRLAGSNVPLNINDFNEVARFALENSVRLVIVGPEEPLVNGIYDYFKSDTLLNHIAIVGPSKAGAMLEGSKDFAKQFMHRHGIPTAASVTFKAEQSDDAEDYIRSHNGPYVLKADGLAAGKGVIIENDTDKAVEQIRDMLQNKRFGKASAKVVIEEFLTGIELSVFVVTDGKNYVLLPEAKDYKRIGEADTGLNTGGMGSVSPVPFAQGDFMDKVVSTIIEPTIKGLAKEQIDYKGFIFFGLINVAGEPYVIEYNVRMGDPETESVIARLNEDIVPILIDCASGKLVTRKATTDIRAAATIMLVSGGYPGDYKKGYFMHGLPNAQEIELSGKTTLFFHAGTTTDEVLHIVTSGGRVIAITTLAYSHEEALETSLAMCKKVEFEGKYYRKDIGFDIC